MSIQVSTTRREVETATFQIERSERRRTPSVIGLATGISGLLGGYALYESGNMLASGVLASDHSQKQAS